MHCRNHPTEPATHTADMPSGEKQPDGRYVIVVPLCTPCAERVETIGFATTSVFAA